MKLRVFYPSGIHKEYTFEQPKIRLGRDETCELVFPSADFPKVSGLHAEIVNQKGKFWLVHRSQSNSTLLQNQEITKPSPLSVGDRFRLGFTGPEIELVSLNPTAPIDGTIFAGRASDYLKPAAVDTTRFEIGVGGTIGREQKTSDFVLAHPHVSRRHAKLKASNGQAIIADLNSSNGTYVNGERIKAPKVIRAGDTLDIGPFTLVFDGQFLSSRSRANNVRLDVEHVFCAVTDFVSKKQLKLLTGVSFHVDPGEFVAVLGPSGSGKSTLLGIASGRSWPSSGIVNVNDRDLHRNFSAIKEDLIVVPQATTLHDSLSVKQTMQFTAALRLPKDTTAQEVESRVRNTLTQIGLSNRASTKVKQLSGGQLKRLRLACELISDPSLLFLDEVTSGLDEQADGEMMELFRGLADAGKTIVCVTHNLSHVEKFCHKVLVLTVGGRVAFYGSPEKTLDYFRVGSLHGVYATLGTRQPKEWATMFVNSEYFPQQIQKLSAVRESEPKAGHGVKALVNRAGLKMLAQTIVLVKRYVCVWLGDMAALVALFGQAILVTFLLCLVFSSIPDADEIEKIFVRKTEIRNLLFLLGISCFWLGANNSAKEIVKERKIYQRERDFNLIPEAFWASKVVVLSLIGFLQAFIVSASVVALCDLPGSFLGFVIISLIVSFLGTNLGLAISANSKSEELAVALVPAVIIPQIILAGVVANLNSFSLLLAKVLTTSFWGQKLYERALEASESLPSDFEPTAIVCLAVLTLHLFVFVVATGLGLRFLKVKER